MLTLDQLRAMRARWNMPSVKLTRGGNFALCGDSAARAVDILPHADELLARLIQLESLAIAVAEYRRLEERAATYMMMPDDRRIIGEAWHAVELALDASTAAPQEPADPEKGE